MIIRAPTGIGIGATTSGAEELRLMRIAISRPSGLRKATGTLSPGHVIRLRASASEEASGEKRRPPSATMRLLPVTPAATTSARKGVTTMRSSSSKSV